jgi:hypothetical protein
MIADTAPTDDAPTAGLPSKGRWMFGVRIADMNILNRGNDLVFAAIEILARPYRLSTLPLPADGAGGRPMG